MKKSVQKPGWMLTVGGLFCCLFLFSACGTAVFSAGNPAPTPSPITAADQKQLATFKQLITQWQQQGQDSSSYQKEYTHDHTALNTPNAVQHKKAQQTLKADITGLQGKVKLVSLKNQYTSLHQQLQQKVATYGQQNAYNNDYDQTSYPFGYEYGDNGGEWVLDQDFANGESVDAYQSAVNDLQTLLTNFDAMNSNTSDTTIYSMEHQTDLQLMQHYKVTDKKVVVVSLHEEAMRVYQSGQLVKSFLVTTGKPGHPSLPGVWTIEDKLSPTTFKSGAAPGSEDYYAPTPINYAMQYHDQGYFLHDSWWRADYGPGTQFPHQDSTGNDSASSGSHGCVNLSTDDAAWLYDFVDFNTTVIVY